jgi:hypothetical protein
MKETGRLYDMDCDDTRLDIGDPRDSKKSHLAHRKIT